MPERLTRPLGDGSSVRGQEVVRVRAGEAAVAAGVSVKALRYYEGLGLVRPQRQSNGYRVYSAADVRAAAEIRGLMALGLTTQEAEPFLECLRTGHDAADDCAESIAAYQRKIDQLEELIARLSRARVELHERMGQAARRGFRPTPDHVSPRKDNVMALPEADPLPEGLPVPVDDGAARHLPGRVLPGLFLPSTDGSRVQLDAVSPSRWVLFVYPLTGEPGVDVPRGWDEIPGARGCSQEACSFRDNLDQLRSVGVEQVLALSSDQADYQQDLAARLRLPYRLLSDPYLQVAGALGLPTFTADVLPPPASAGSQRLYRRLTMVLHGPVIEHVFYPVFPPDRHAEEVLDWVRTHPTPQP